ncbi:DUF937 domain-containing protein [bacterium]|nr:MAG: DUF937 domain-containing protein [bacterium]
MDLTQAVLGSLDQSTRRRIADSSGASPDQVSQVIAAGLPLIVGSMAKNASTKDGASQIDGALSKKHDGSLLDDLSGLTDGVTIDDGTKILGHVLGQNKDIAVTKVAEKSGTSPNATATILATLAPVVMAQLGKQKATGKLTAQDVGKVLTSQKGAKGTALMDLAIKFFDKNGDGSVLDDVIGMFFGSKKAK